MEEKSSRKIFEDLIQHIILSTKKARLTDNEHFPFSDGISFGNYMCFMDVMRADMLKFMSKHVKRSIFNFRDYFIVYIYEKLKLVEFLQIN